MDALIKLNQDAKTQEANDDGDDNSNAPRAVKTRPDLNVGDARSVRGVNGHILRMQEATQRGAVGCGWTRDSLGPRSTSCILLKHEGPNGGRRRPVTAGANTQGGPSRCVGHTGSTTEASLPARSWTMYAGELCWPDMTAPGDQAAADAVHDPGDHGAAAGTETVSASGTGCTGGAATGTVWAWGAGTGIASAGAATDTACAGAGTGLLRRWHSLCLSLDSLQVRFHGVPGSVQGGPSAGDLPRGARASRDMGKAASRLRRKTEAAAALARQPGPLVGGAKHDHKRRRRPQSPERTAPAPPSPGSPLTPCSGSSAGSCDDLSASSPAAAPAGVHPQSRRRQGTVLTSPLIGPDATVNGGRGS